MIGFVAVLVLGAVALAGAVVYGLGVVYAEAHHRSDIERGVWLP